MQLARKLWTLLSPFHHTFFVFLGLLVLFEGIQLVEGSIPSLAITMFSNQSRPQDWIGFVIIIFCTDLVVIWFDNRLDWLIIAQSSYPIYNHLKTVSMKKFLELDLGWHQKHNSGALIGKMNRGIDKVSALLDMVYWEFVPTLIQTVLTIIPLVLLSWPTILVFAIGLVFFMDLSIKSYYARKPLRDYRHDQYEAEWSWSTQMVQSIQTVAMFGQKQRAMDRLAATLTDVQQTGTKEARIGVYKYGRRRMLVTRLSRIAIWIIWISQMSAGILTIPALVYLNTLSEKLFHSFWRFARLFENATEASESVDRLVDLLTQTSVIPSTGVDFGEVPPSIRMCGVSFNYYADSQNGGLNQIDLVIRAGEKVAFVGPSGAGKTTMWRLITGTWRGEGDIFIGEKPVREWQPDALLAMFSFVPQGDDVYIYDDTVANNIAFGRPGATIDEIRTAAQMAGIAQFIEEKLTDGYLTMVGERGVKLSGGQKQRVALARAILANRPILILDEATSSVDAITESEIQERMGTILKGKTAIIIAHRLSTVRDITDRIIVMDQGQIVEEGTHQTLMENDGLYAQMVTLQTAM